LNGKRSKELPVHDQWDTSCGRHSRRQIEGPLQDSFLLSGSGFGSFFKPYKGQPEKMVPERMKMLQSNAGVSKVVC
jgi:hypothetical protein